MSNSSLKKAPEWVYVPGAVVTLWIVVLMVQTFLGRVDYPFDLEWMEGGMLIHGLRVSEGQPLYVTPSAEFIPFIYPPLFAWLLGGLGKIFGVTYALGRSIAFVGSMAAAAALIPAVRGEKGSFLLGLTAAGMFLSGFDETGGFFDLVRNDGLLIGLLAWSLVAVRHGWLRTGGALLTLAFMAKHNAAIFGLPTLIWLSKTQGRDEALTFVKWSVVPALAFTGLMMLEGDGLFLTYILGVPAAHPFVFNRFLPLAPKEMLSALPWSSLFVVVVGLFWLVGPRSTGGTSDGESKQPRRWSDGGVFWVSHGALAFVFCMVMRGHYGGYMNVLIPGVWVLALWGALAVGAVHRRWPHLWVGLLLSCGLAAQIWTEQWKQERFLPTDSDRAAGEVVLAEVRAIEGPVLAPQFPWLPVQAGKKPSLHLITLWDLDKSGGPLRDNIDGVKQSIKNQEWNAILVDKKEQVGALKRPMKSAYKRGSSLDLKGRKFFPKTGWKVRPKYLYVPK